MRLRGDTNKWLSIIWISIFELKKCHQPHQLLRVCKPVSNFSCPFSFFSTYQSLLFFSLFIFPIANCLYLKGGDEAIRTGPKGGKGTGFSVCLSRSSTCLPRHESAHSIRSTDKQGDWKHWKEENSFNNFYLLLLKEYFP